MSTIAITTTPLTIRAIKSPKQWEEIKREGCVPNLESESNLELQKLLINTPEANRVLHQTHSVKLNALLLSPSRLKVPTRHQTVTVIQKFTEVNKSSLEVIVYLIDAGSLGNDQVEVV
ncbi:hypothetical protein N7519_005377 [Penicillium mononematosum]|uniref:uncharacterized protein n=1 Tax=Penicillium mononematosum TaxID=268346 RepID=UPI0025471A80|nr:uncharacterized protein N7519_005377 [Penicillium mononematosum]KAJ6184076.1 hypothetical protein N7519_005377 [Penicillium mononematosum]